MFNRLCNYLKEYNNIVVAFSGGVDSTLVCLALKKADKNFVAVTVSTPLHTKSEVESAALFCTKNDIKHIIINSDVLPTIGHNPIDRCYHCKKHIFTMLMDYAQNNGYNYVFDGSILDDDNEYRPGKKALSELGIISPLKINGLYKTDVRSILKDIGFLDFNKESMPCMATRFPYNNKITIDKLKVIELGENLLRQDGLKGVRLRIHDNIARIECDDAIGSCNKISKDTILKIKQYGIDFVTLDLLGYQKGVYDNK